MALIAFVVGIPALAGLSALHGLVRPHPGPLLAIEALGADLGLTLGLGLLVALLLTALFALFAFGTAVGRRLQAAPAGEALVVSAIVATTRLF